MGWIGKNDLSANSTSSINYDSGNFSGIDNSSDEIESFSEDDTDYDGDSIAMYDGD